MRKQPWKKESLDKRERNLNASSLRWKLLRYWQWSGNIWESSEGKWHENKSHFSWNAAIQLENGKMKLEIGILQ